MPGASEQGPPQNDPRIYFAAERTFLAWIRTGLGLMGVGFAVSRFGLFLRQFQAEAHFPSHSTGFSLWSGIGLVALGVVVNIVSVIKHVQLIHELSSGTWQAGRVSREAVALALLLAAVGISMGFYLALIR